MPLCCAHWSRWWHFLYGWAGWPQGKAAVDQQIHRPSGDVKITIEHGDLQWIYPAIKWWCSIVFSKRLPEGTSRFAFLADHHCDLFCSRRIHGDFAKKILDQQISTDSGSAMTTPFWPVLWRLLAHQMAPEAISFGPLGWVALGLWRLWVFLADSWWSHNQNNMVVFTNILQYANMLFDDQPMCKTYSIACIYLLYIHLCICIYIYAFVHMYIYIYMHMFSTCIDFIPMCIYVYLCVYFVHLQGTIAPSRSTSRVGIWSACGRSERVGRFPSFGLFF